MDVADEKVFFPVLVCEPKVFKDFLAVFLLVWVFSHPFIAAPLNYLLFVDWVFAGAFCRTFVNNIWLVLEFVLVYDVIIQVENCCLN